MPFSPRTRVLQLGVLVLLALARSAAGDTGDWESLYDVGVEADDVADYKAAVAALSQSCEFAASATGSGPQSKACLKLSLVYAIQGKLKKARATCERLLARLETLTPADPADVVDVLLMLADIHSAEGSSRLALDTMQQALPYLEKLPPITRSRAFFRMAEFYLPFEGKTTGDKLLRSAQLTLLSVVNYRDPAYVEAATDFAWVLTNADRPADTQGIQVRLLEEGKKLFAEDTAPEQALGAAYVRAARRTAGRRNEDGEQDATASDAAKLASEWSVKLDGRGDIHSLGNGEVERPRLLSKKNPTYTGGALQAGVEGRTILMVEIWPDGRAHNVHVLRRLPYGLSWSAIEAVRKWRFAPETIEGKGVKVSTTVEVRFKIR